jgi:hypothetical protein
MSAVVLAIDLATGQDFMFLRSWPEELDFVNQALAFPLNTLPLIVGAFMFHIFYLIFVVRRFDNPAPTTERWELAEQTA